MRKNSAIALYVLSTHMYNAFAYIHKRDSVLLAYASPLQYAELADVKAECRQLRYALEYQGDLVSLSTVL